MIFSAVSVIINIINVFSNALKLILNKKGDLILKLPDISRLFGIGGARTFKGGIHPDDMKTNTCEKPIIDLPGPDVAVFPMQQHIGAPCKPCVKVGERVFMGQLIGEAGGFVSANIHSSVSGTVKAIEPRMHPSGVMTESIVIENDGLDEMSPDISPNSSASPSAKEIIDAVKKAGIVGMGGAAFPTHVKLSPPPDKKIEYVIVNGAECEPYLTSDHRAMLETSNEVIDGLKLIMSVFGLSEGYIGIETNKPDAIAHMRECAARETEVKIHVIPVKTKYPQGSEKQLIDAITGRRVPPGKLPMDVGAVVDNIDTCAAIARAVRLGTPLMRRIVTVSGDCIENPLNFRVRIGTSFEYIIEKSGGFREDPAKIIMGGPMMGIAVPDLSVPIIKGSSGILAFSRKMLVGSKEQSCLRCGKCVSGCPMHLLPNKLKEAADKEDIKGLDALHISDCIQCGSCTFVCPANQNPLQSIRTGKIKLNNLKREEVKN